MATPTAAPSPETPITIKVTLSTGENRRIKLPLRELGANTLPDKLRSILQIPPNQNVIFERYSDSASAYIKLDSNNPAVYKQLYRAAKAKLKLRIRASVSTIPTEPATSVTPPVLPMPGHHLTPYCYVPPMNPDPLKSASLESLKQKPSTQTFSSPQHVPHICGATPIPVPISSSKEALLETMGLAPKDVSKKEDVPQPPRYVSAREQFYAELASLSSKDSKQTLRSVPQPMAVPTTSFTICCNHCDAAIPDAHYHCSKCDDGDFDLCESCYNKSIRCHGDDHWLVKRGVKNGKVTSSFTETVAPKATLAAFFDREKNHQPTEPQKEVPGAFSQEIKEAFQQPMDESRTCNSCIGHFDESNFVTCTQCDDYDLCIACHVQNRHGHHPSHAFMPASKETSLNMLASRLLGPGRNVRHAAICDGCDKDITGVRHKCLSCPDWDYCSGCIATADHEHPGHRFVPIYEAISNPSVRSQRHYGINCDGPLCVNKVTYIVGDRYKCAVCHDTDFCANCEALPKNGHNRTHPLIKFKTPVKNVSVTTLGEKENGEHSYTVGDHMPQTMSKSTETNPAAASANAATQVQTMVEVAPTEPVKIEPKVEPKPDPVVPSSELDARFIRDIVADGTVLAAGEQFKQVWTLRNPGPHAWPVGCSVRFVGGDAMYDVDSDHPIDVKDLLKTTESNTTDRIIKAGEEVDFTVFMRTPHREGQAISYWRLKAADGFPFGHKLWCDIKVRKAEPTTTEPKSEPVDNVTVEKVGKDMIFPKLDKESPVSSTHEAMLTERITVPDAVYPGHETDTMSNTADNGRGEEEALVEEVGNLDLDDSETDDGFLTDEEYEMLTASEDEFKEAKNGKK